jgi:O-antigen ligase
MAIGIAMESCVVMAQRFIFGEFQSAGTFDHQNTLGMISHFVAFPFFALLLAGQPGWQPIAVPISSAIIALLTVSRATLGLGGLGYAIVFALSALRRWTSRKGILALAVVILIGAFAPLAFSSLETRFSLSPTSADYDERGAFERAAAAIVSDHPMGIGANSYVVIANSKGYNQRAGVAYNEGSSSAHVHNVYRLVAAESGYFGLITFLVLLIQPLLVAFLWGWRNRGDVRGDLLLGLGVSLIIVYLHSFFEWIFVTYDVQYFFSVILGLIAGSAQQLGYRRSLRAKKAVKFIL